MEDGIIGYMKKYDCRYTKIKKGNVYAMNKLGFMYKNKVMDINLAAIYYLERLFAQIVAK